VPDALPVIAAHQTGVSLQLQGRRSAGVDIVDMRVRVLGTGPPLTGTLVLGPGPQGADESTVLQTTVDDPVPRLTQAGSDQPYFATHHVTLAHDEPFLLVLTVTAARAAVRWDLEIDYVADGRAGTEYVGAGGVVHGDADPQPFAITATPPRLREYRVVYTTDVRDPDWRVRLVTPDQDCAAEHALYPSLSLGC
jgi:hypothetical protein